MKTFLIAKCSLSDRLIPRGPTFDVQRGYMKDTADSLKLPSKIHGPEIPHLVGLDVARVVAGLGVIWYHSANMYNNLGFFRMPFFTALLAFLVVEGAIYHPRRTFGDFFRSRVMRLLLPFAIWLVLYRVPNILSGHLVMPL